MIDDLLERMRQMSAANEEPLRRTAEAIVATGRADGLVRPAGAGHSLVAVMETFFRAGGLAFVRPLWHERILPLASAGGSTSAEREPGLGRGVAEAAGIRPEDTVIVYSTSGVNPYPVEIAQVARAAGAQVVAVTSVAASRRAPLRAGVRLMDVVDVVIDTPVPPGDVSWPLAAPVTAPVSSLANTCVWAEVLRRVHDLAPEVPCWRSANIEGNDELNRVLEERFGPRIPEL